ncbi:pseudouridine synthase [Mycotypha africana]|uniref:pseudouridine synthase n=1 Tax=Mycotypha africana TaxID=64632 RepID=UPI002301B2CB|nr:pseudouridine synthase [Mycotypha africana]KAI8988393.1 pseudouridine synthase [Mycotypha africana]
MSISFEPPLRKAPISIFPFLFLRLQSISKLKTSTPHPTILPPNSTMIEKTENRLDLPISVIYRDEEWFVIDKPYDCKIQNYPNSTEATVESILKQQFPEVSKFRNVHQLDYATSGVFVLALNKKAAAEASKLFRERLVKKTYIALVNGHLSDNSYFVDKPIAEDPNHAFRMRIDEEGKPAQTNIEVLERGYYTFKEVQTGQQKSIPATKVKLSPISGRRHQLRLHLKHIGHPIIGDYNYEDIYTDTFRMMLHAYQITLPLLEKDKEKALTITATDPFIHLLSTADIKFPEMDVTFAGEVQFKRAIKYIIVDYICKAVEKS